jgi:hypothetical protein
VGSYLPDATDERAKVRAQSNDETNDPETGRINHLDRIRGCSIL